MDDIDKIFDRMALRFLLSCFWTFLFLFILIENVEVMNPLFIITIFAHVLYFSLLVFVFLKGISVAYKE